jgi:6-phosphogluconolactonase/glucosamine-6-phosphate isomerase/deaminase
VSEDVPASLVRDHDNITFIIDRDAASKLEKEY